MNFRIRLEGTLQKPSTSSSARYADIKVLETIKGGHSVYRRDQAKTADAAGFERSCAASAKCFSAMAHVGAAMIGEELHRH